MIQTELVAAVPELLRRHAAARPAKIAFRDRRTVIDYGSLAATTGNLAANLAALGLTPGDRIAIHLPNGVLWVQSCLAVARMGCVGVPISHDASPNEISYRLADSGSRAVITTARHGAALARSRDDFPALMEIIVADDGGDAGEGRKLEELLRSTAAGRDAADLDAPAWILYTSGTTGRAKGVVLTQRGMLWVVAACWAPIAGLGENDHVLSPLPLFHSYALNLSVLGVLAVGASEYIMERFSTRECLTLLRGQPFSLFPGVPTMFHYLMEGAGTAGTGFPALRRCVSAGAIMPASLNRAFEDRFAVPLLDGYGITETSTMVTMNGPTGTRIMGSCGLPVPGLAVRIVDPATGTDMAPGRDGELIVRGPNVMAGYHGKPAETEAALKDGWYRTGDLARADPHGYITITGRLKELIIRGGQNIAPAEIEEAALAHGGVADCAVVGRPHPQLGEVPVLFVVERPGHPLDAAALLSHCRSRLSAYKVPAAVHRIAEIPRTGSGKVMRFKLRELLDGAS